MGALADIYRGDSKTYNCVFTNKSDGSPIDITGCSLWFTMKKSSTDSDVDAILQKEIDTHTDATNGKTKIPLSSDETDIEPGNYYYDFQLVCGNEVTTLAVDKLCIKKDITRSK